MTGSRPGENMLPSPDHSEGEPQRSSPKSKHVLRPCPICRAPYFQASSLKPGCSTVCRMEIQRQKDRKRAAKDERRETKAALERLKTMNKICEEAQRAVNLFVRVRDFGKGCISCDTGRVEQAGHFFPIGSKFRNNRLRFDTRAIHGQCIQCNNFVGGGNVRGYEAGLIARYGQTYVDELYEIKRQAEHGELAPLTREEVAEIKARHWKEAKVLGRASNAAACA
jgi:endogenous inhibitor of DNA gyrase (YacG/DUF329 family)